MQLILILAGGVLLLTGVVYAIGYLSPKNYNNILAQKVDAGLKVIWDYITDFENKNSNRSGIKSVEIIERDKNGFPSKFKEITDSGGYLVFQVIDKEDFKKLHVRIIESSLEITGDWIYHLVSNGDKTELTINENMEVKKLPIRAIMTIVGRNKNIKNEFKNIRKHIESKK